MSTTFAALGVPRELTRVLDAQGITEPFPIQAATLPDGLAGRDVCGRAPTGSGKTLAFGLPLAARVTHAQPKRPKALVLVPTRELAAQVRDELQQLARPMGRTVHAFYGGVGFGPQLAALRKGVDIAVACPGRLADLVQRGDIRLDRVNLVVVDEADRMADMGFLPEVRRLLDQVMPDRQTMLFSATLDGEVDTLIRRYQENPVRHGVDHADDAPVNHHVLWHAERDRRVELTAEITSAHWPAIVFSRTKHGADRLSRQLSKLGVAAEAIHGNRSQPQRGRALRSFSSGRVQALVATDVAARGIHVDGVACVIHFDAPPDSKDFVHRSGRTGRAGSSGIVVTLTPAADAKTVAKMMRTAGVDVTATQPDVRSLGRPVLRQRPSEAPRQPSADRTSSPDADERRADGRPARKERRRSPGTGPAPAKGRHRDRDREEGARGPHPSPKGRKPRSRPRTSDPTAAFQLDLDGRPVPTDRAARSGPPRQGGPRTQSGRSGRPRTDGGRPGGSRPDGARARKGRPGGGNGGGPKSSSRGGQQRGRR